MPAKSSVDGSALKRTVVGRRVMPGGSSDAGTVASTAAQRRHRILETSARSMHTRSLIDSATEGSGEPELVREDLYGDGGRPTLEEKLLQKMEHHGLRRCLGEVEDVAKQLQMSATGGSSCPSRSEDGGGERARDAAHHQQLTDGALHGRPQRAPNYYLCVPCEAKVTGVLTSAPTVDDVASAIRHCSSAAHRLYARCMSLAEIDASLFHSPMPNPAMFTTMVVNGVRVLVGTMPGGSTMFHPDAVETEAAMQHADDGFFGSSATETAVQPSSSGRRGMARLLTHSQQATQLHELMRPRRMLEYLRRVEGSGGVPPAGVVKATDVAQQTTNPCVEGVDDRVLPSGTTTRSAFLYRPLQQFVDATAIWVPSTARTHQRHRATRHAHHEGVAKDKDKKDREDSRTGGWMRIPAGCVAPTIAPEYVMRTLTPTRLPVVTDDHASHKCCYTSSVVDSLPVTAQSSALSVAGKSDSAGRPPPSPLKVAASGSALRIAVEEDSVHTIQLVCRKRRRSGTVGIVTLRSGGGNDGAATAHATTPQTTQPSLTQQALSQLHDDDDEPEVSVTTPAAADDDEIRFFDRVRRFSRHHRSQQRRQRRQLAGGDATGVGGGDDGATDWS